MSEQERIDFRNKLEKGLKHSYEKMLKLKMKLGQSVVISDGHGNPLIISAEEAWKRYQNEN